MDGQTQKGREGGKEREVGKEGGRERESHFLCRLGKIV